MVQPTSDDQEQLSNSAELLPQFSTDTEGVIREIRSTEERLSIALEASEMGAFDGDILAGTLFCTPEVERIFGFKLGCDLVEAFRNTVYVEDIPSVVEAYRHAALNRTIFVCEFRFLHSDGTLHWMTASGRPFFNQAGEPTRVIGVLQDITQRRLADEWLRYQNEVLEKIATGEPVSDVIHSIVRMLEAGFPGAAGSLMLLDSHSRLQLMAAPSLPEELCLLLRDIPIGPKAGSCGTAAFRKETVIVTDTATDPLWESYRELAKKFGLHCCWSFPIIAPSNACLVLGAFAIYHPVARVPHGDQMHRIQQAVRLASIALERHRNEEALVDSERRFRDLAEAMPLMVWTSDSQGNNTYCNQRLRDTIGPLREWHDAIHPDDRALVISKYEESIATGEPYQVEHRLRVIDSGEYRWFFARGIASRDHQGNIICWYGAAMDIHDLKQTEQELRDERDRLSAIASASPSALFSLKQSTVGECRFTFASPTISAIFGDSPEALIDDSNRAWSKIKVDDFAATSKLMEKAFRDETALQTSFRVEHPTKGTIWIECLASSTRCPSGGVYWHGVMADVSRRKVLEARLMQSEKMEAIGRLAGGVAHDFNNLLTVILGSCRLLQKELQSCNNSSASTINIDAISQSSQKAASLTKQLLAFSRQQEIAPRQIDLNALIRESELIFRRLMDPHVNLEFILQPSLHPIIADATQLEQILINLIVNARDSIEGRGNILLSTQNVRRSRATPSATTEAAGDYVELKITDSGSGMTSEVQARMFDPFFTTKPSGRSTGLGLAVVHGTVTQNHGFIEVDSQVDFGTRISIYLPAVIGEELVSRERFNTGAATTSDCK